MKRPYKKTHHTYELFFNAEIEYYKFRGAWCADIAGTDIVAPATFRAHYKKEVVAAARNHVAGRQPDK